MRDYIIVDKRNEFFNGKPYTFYKVYERENKGINRFIGNGKIAGFDASVDECLDVFFDKAKKYN